MKLSINLFTTLDGVAQGPGSAEEDTRNGFTKGGWLIPYADQVMGSIVDDEWYRHAEVILLGRRTYDTFYPHWSHVTDPNDLVATTLNSAPKYVVSSTLDNPQWNNTTVLGQDFVDRIAELKERPGQEIQVHGSVRLAQTLHAAGLVDLYRLLIFPVALGQGTRLFTDDSPAHSFEVLSSTTTSTGATGLTMTPGQFRSGQAGIVDGKDTVIS